MYYIYYWFHTLVAGVLPSGGANGYVQELWIATALLGFTFPVIASFTGFREKQYFKSKEGSDTTPQVKF
jgi:hypothetical protein